MSKNGKFYLVSPTESELTSRGKRHVKLANELIARGFQVIYITTNFDHAHKRLFTDKEISKAKKRVLYDLHFLKIGEYKKHISLKRFNWHRRLALELDIYFSDKVQHSDVIIIPSRPVELIKSVSKIKDELGCRIFMDIRDVWPDSLPLTHPFVRWIFNTYCNSKLYSSVKKYDGFAHVSDGFVEWLHRYAPHTVSTWIPLGYDENRWLNCSHSSYKEGGIVNLFYCGTLTGACPLHHLLEAVSSLNQYKLTLAGDSGSGSKYPATLNYCKEHLAGRFSLNHILSYDKVVDIYDNSHIALVPIQVPSLLPNKIFDALGSAVPMLVMGNGAASDFVKKYDIGWVTELDSEIIRNVLTSITKIDFEKKRQNIINMRKQFSHKETIKQLADCIERLAI